MNTLQRLLSNTALAFVANIIVRLSTSVLFIAIGRQLGPTDAGIFTLGTTYYTIVFGLSAFGLHELLVREVAPRKDESGRYLSNYLFMRVLFSIVAYLLLIVALRWVLPYNETTEQVIRILSLAAIPEAAFSILQALFEAHERLAVPAAAAVVNSAVKLVAGLLLITAGAGVTTIAWVMVAGSLAGLLVFLPALWRLFRTTPQTARSQLNTAFSLQQLRETPGFFVIHLFSVLDYQTDAFLISLLLTETDLGFYTAALTITLAISMLSFAVRAAIYPLMARYKREAPDKLALLHEKATLYLIVLALPVATGVALLAQPIIRLVYGEAFLPAVPVLQVTIWAAVFILINVPNARLLLIHNRQQAASAITGVSMGVNVAANLLLIPVLGIVGSAVARVISSGVFFFTIYGYVQRRIGSAPFWSLLPRPMLATAIMAAAVWPARDLPLLVPIMLGAAVYMLAAYLLRVVPRSDIAYWQQLVRTRSS